MMRQLKKLIHFFFRHCF